MNQNLCHGIFFSEENKHSSHSLNKKQMYGRESPVASLIENITGLTVGALLYLGST